MKRLVVALAVIGMIFTGCTGTFKLTRAVYDIHRQQQEKWMDELIFLAVVIVPVYSIAMIGDAVIFNTIEFWTGENPLASGNSNTNVVSKQAQGAVMHYDQIADTVTIEAEGAPGALILERDPAGVLMHDGGGKILYTSSRDTLGGVSVYAGNQHLIRYFSPQEVEQGRQGLIVQ